MTRWWQGRYSDLRRVQSGGGFQTLTALDAHGRRRLLVTPADGTPTAFAREVLDEVRRVHGLLEHPWIPKPTGAGEVDGVPLVEFDCNAVVDMPGVLRMMIDASQKIPQPQADALITGLRVALQAAHAVRDPRTGEPVCFGRLAYANVFFSRGGAVWLAGFGRNFALERADMGLDPSLTCFQAPEMLVGGRPSPTGDYVAVIALMRSLVHFVELSPVLARILRGDGLVSDRAVVTIIRWFNEHVMGQTHGGRPTIEQAVRRTKLLRRLIGVELDDEGLHRWITERLRGYEPPDPFLDDGAPVATGAADLTVGPEGEWFAYGGERRELGARPSLRRLLFALASQRIEMPGRPVCVWELIDLAWPGERIDPVAAPNRLYVAINRLRETGLRDVIEHVDNGYRIDPARTVEVLPHDAAKEP